MLDLYTEVTDRVIAALEQGTVPWRKPWTGGSSGCISFSTGRPYSLLNHLLLGGVSGEYATFAQIQQHGGHVRRGEKAHKIVFWRFLKVLNEDTQEEKEIPYLRYISVFHLDQCEGIQPRWRASLINEPGKHLKPDEAADGIIQDYVTRSGVKLTVRNSDRAYYSPSLDEVVLPELAQYTQMEQYYSTALHELVHSTGHVSRLNRLHGDAAFGNEVYSREELTAELGSAFIMSRIGLETAETFEQSTAYLAGWLNALKNDKRMLIPAAGAAQKAAMLILNEKEEEKDGSQSEAV